MLGAEQIEACYPEEYYGGPATKFRLIAELVVPAVARRHINFLSRGLRPGANVLDVGCGRGALIRPLANRGFEVHGVEPV
jgi:2-polyprenyl-3-methyl-5-hydroxy-6-metoxy-1,4-benzoquinol methylase